MKKPDSARRTRRTLLLAALLAVLCIGLAELAACAHFAPALYRRITAPARRAAGAAAQVCCETASAVSRASEAAHLRVAHHAAAVRPLASAFLKSLTETEEEPPSSEQESQLAGEPELDAGASAADPAVTELNVINGQEILTGGAMPIVYFNQGAEPWAEQPYGTDDIGRYGCGPTAMAIVVSSMTETAVDPAEMARLAVSGGYWAKRSGSYLSIVQGLAAQAGLSAASLQYRTPDTVMDYLLNGSLLVALMGPGHFTKGGHFIVLRGVTLSGKVLVADPNSVERSLTEWEPELILEELSKSTAHGAPLWVISQKDPS